MVRTQGMVVIGCNPPSRTSGQRTLARVEQARVILGFESVLIANLFALPSFRSGGLSELGREPVGWHRARSAMVDALSEANGVLLAYGTQEPSGSAREHFRDQVAWLDHEIETRCLPTWWVGCAPRHPSRWQRYTSRVHPGLSYDEALRESLSRRGAGVGSVSLPP